MTRLVTVEWARLVLPPLAAMAVAAGMVWRGPHLHGTVTLPTVVIDGKEHAETCLLCHGDEQGLGTAHDPTAIGCSPCHLGNPAGLEENEAHEGMQVVAGNLTIAARTCGRAGCHPDETARVERSAMAGAPGLLAVNRFAFGERDTPRVEPGDDLRQLRGDEAASPAESHVRKLCASCHVGLPKTEVGDHGFASRGGGCTACHLGAPSLEGKATGRLHPDVSAAVRPQRCEGCHARSGRISLSFTGRVELEPDDPRVEGKLPDGRPIGKAPADVHARAGFTCLDCHTERGLMGDGTVVGHGYEAVDIACEDCHQPGPAPESPPEATRVAGVLRASWARRGGPRLAGEPYRTGRGTPLWRTDAASGQQWLHETGKAVPIPPMRREPYHGMRGHERLSCQACHTTWMPRCTQCHTQYRENDLQYDHIAGKETPGSWHETAGGNGFGPALLAVGPKGKIVPFTEGMTLTVEGVANRVDRVLWAPLDPHTTGASRTCAECHPDRDASAVYPSEGQTTREGARLLSRSEVETVRQVGRCVACHDGYDDPVYADFEVSVGRLRGRGEARAADRVRWCASPVD